MGNFAKTISLLLAGSFLISASFFRIPDSGRATFTDCAEDFSDRAMQEDCVNCAQFLRRRETYREETALFMLRSKTGKKEYDVTVRYEKEKNGEEREVGRSWVDLETDLLDFCKNNAKDAVDARLFFDGKKFTYTPEQNGVYCDYARSLDLALAALREGKNGSEVVQAEFIPRITVKMLRERNGWGRLPLILTAEICPVRTTSPLQPRASPASNLRRSRNFPLIPSWEKGRKQTGLKLPTSFSRVNLSRAWAAVSVRQVQR